MRIFREYAQVSSARPFRFKNVALESYALHLPEVEVTSAEVEDRLAPLYERLRIPMGTLERLSGVKTRRLWDAQLGPSVFATEVTEQVLEKSQVSRDAIGALVSCSVTRDFFEPATSSLVHGNLGLPETAFSFDITNACIGFSNGMQIIANLIESGVIEAGIVVSAENVSCILESSMRRIHEKDDLDRDELVRLLPTFTLGCGAAAMVLCHRSLAPDAPRIVGCVGRSASQHNQLCKGNGDFYILQKEDLNPIMHTESHGLLAEAAKLGRRMWNDFSEAFEWSREEIDHIFCHQVGKQVNNAFYDEMTLDISKEFTTYQRLGNLVSASLPAAVFTGVEEKPVKKGDKVLLTAFGSGLNSIFVGIEW